MDLNDACLNENNSAFSNEIKRKIVLTVVLAIITIVILRCAWTCDDAYISFRTIYNFTHGYGLTFNVNERVQSFTDPLWVLVLSIPYYFTNEAYFTSILTGAIFSLATCYLILNRTVKQDDYVNTALITTLIISSKAFIDFSTSGLENPLSNFLYVLFFMYLYQNVPVKAVHFKNLSCISALAGVNRLDTLLFYIPILLYLFLKQRDIKIIKSGFIGFIPLLAWELFSLIYYGFPFPNTYYTKLNTGLDQDFYTLQGLCYYVNSFNLDPITLSSIFLTFILAIFLLKVAKDKKLILLIIGVVLYLVYTLYVGGDFMSGRYFTVPFCASMCFLSQYKLHKSIALILLTFILILSFSSPYSPILSNEKYRKNDSEMQTTLANNGIADERAFYYQASGLLLYSPKLYNAELEKKIKLFPKFETIEHLHEEKIGLGYSGYGLPPSTYIFHHMALSDALLARLPILNAPSLNWRIGHYFRKVPSGYKASLHTNVNMLKDKDLFAYYEKLKLIISGDVFSIQRLFTVVKMNMGNYNDFIDKEKYKALDYEYHPIDFNGQQEFIVKDTISVHGEARIVNPDSNLENEYISWGPFIAIPHGKYKISFNLKISDNAINKPVAEIDTYSTQLNGLITKRVLNGTDFTSSNKYQEFDLELPLISDVIDLEFRIKYFKRGELANDFVRIIKLK